MTEINVTIIIPVYNSSNYLEKCLTSLVNQSYKGIRIIVVNDGSTDNSLEIAKSFSNKFENIKVIDKANGGVSSARNIGIKNTETDYLMFVDSDDYLDEYYVERLISEVYDEDLVIGFYSKFHSEDSPTRQKVNFPLERRLSRLTDLSVEEIKNLYNQDVFNAPVGKLYRHELIFEMFNEDMSLGEDLLFNLNYFQYVKKIRFVDEYGYYYRVNQGSSLSSKFMANRLSQITIVYQESLELFLKIFGENIEVDMIHKKYLEEYALSVKKMLANSSFTTQEKKRLLSTYRKEFPIIKESLTYFNLLSVTFKMFLTLYIKKMDSLLITLVKLAR
ncbi:TPA: glycosyltransferase family 2 protein [Streptococcus suis]|nr:glycosyltransferase family 2 protein [Streptococcus suis]